MAKCSGLVLQNLIVALDRLETNGPNRGTQRAPRPAPAARLQVMGSGFMGAFRNGEFGDQKT